MEKIFYGKELKNILSNRISSYKYPGEILERSTFNKGIDKEAILQAFLDFTSEDNQLQLLKTYENAFNTTQIKDFCNMFDTIDADILQFRLTGERNINISSKIVDTNNYLSLVEYIYAMQCSGKDISSEIKLLTDNFHMLYGYSFDDAYSITIMQALDITSKLQKKDAKFLKLLIKAKEDVFKDKDIELLCKDYNYTTLSARKLNTSLLKSLVQGREDKATFLYFKEIFFGNGPLKESELNFLENHSIDKKLERKINEGYTFKAALLAETATSSSCNLKLAIEYLGIDFHMLKKIDYNDQVFMDLEEKFKLDILMDRLSRPTVIKDNAVQKDLLKETLKYSSMENIVSNLSSENIKYYVENDVFTFDSLRLATPKQKDELIQTCFVKRSSIALKILEILTERYQNVNSLFNRYKYGHYIDLNDMKYGVTFEGATDDEIKRYYKIKEMLIYHNVPEEYDSFLKHIISTTGELIHTKLEWREFLSVFQFSERSIDELKKILYSEEEYETYLKEKEDARNKKVIKDTLEEIEKVKNTFKLKWKFEHKQELINVIAPKVYEKLVSLDIFDDDAYELLAILYNNNCINEDQVLCFFKKGKTKYLAS